METRPYFVFGDILSSALAGFVVGAVAALATQPGWPMAAVMPLGMLFGMVLAAPVQIVCSMFFGAFEVMIPMMLTGMAAGMIVPMKAAATPLTPMDGALWGAGIGMTVLGLTYAANAFLAGDTE
jgi:hypothetical protein